MREMVLKEDGRIVNKKSKRRHKTVKCLYCKSNIDIDIKLELEDFDQLSATEYVFYCDRCGNSTDIIKL